jgi:DNA repair protein RadC
MQPIATLPAERRPRERLLGKEGLLLEPTELIAALLGTGSVSGVMATAERVVGLLGDGCRDASALCRIPGVGPAKASVILAALQLEPALRKLIPSQFAGAPDIYAAMEDTLESAQEQLMVFYLDVRGRRLRRETVSIGTLSASLLHPREIYRPAIVANAAAIILAHNHPSGVSQPSTADIRVTASVARAGETLGIQLLDHVICAREGYASIKDLHPEAFIGIPVPFC